LIPYWNLCREDATQRSMKGIPKPAKKLPKAVPPIRMRDGTDGVRKKKAHEEDQQKVASKVRTRIYRQILALLDIADRLTLDVSSKEDRFGLEWSSLIRQIKEHYKDDVVKIVPLLQTLIMSKEGAQGLPKELYRNLLDYLEECQNFMKWIRSPSSNDPVPEEQENPFMETGQQFKKCCTEMQQQICIFENERGENEESFFS